MIQNENQDDKKMKNDKQKKWVWNSEDPKTFREFNSNHGTYLCVLWDVETSRYSICFSYTSNNRLVIEIPS